MTNASAKRAPTASSIATIAVAAEDSILSTKVHKTRYGSFWHFEDVGRKRSSYLLTVCHRRLGRWHLEPSRAVSAVPIEEICAACRTNKPQFQA